jgi:putative photosynthetic complex assembly protein
MSASIQNGRYQPTGAGRYMPVPFLAGAGIAILGAMVLAAIGGSPTTMPPAKVVATRMLRFDDASNGAVIVTDAQTNYRIAVLAPGTNGFIRATLRGLSHAEGHEEHPRANHPFRLTGMSDGRVILYDDKTQRSLDLEAFGSLNVTAYADLLMAPEPKAASAAPVRQAAVP